MNYAIILAGGIGSRFWPLSRQLEPKQFLKVCSCRSMLEESLARISPLINKKHIYIATNNIHNQRIKDCIKRFGVPLANIFLEPESKNTLAPIAVLSKKINENDSDAVIAVLPSDQFVRAKSRFLNSINKGISIGRRGYIVTLGIPPKRPETGYGYIKVSTKGRMRGSLSYYRIDKFIEKPDLTKAKRYIKDRRYYWNAGIFIFRPDIMLEEIKRFTPDVYKIVMNIDTKKDLNRLWPKLPSISIDYAVMEKTKKTVLIAADYGWMDLGSWQAMEEIMKKDKDGNIFRGSCIDIGSRNSLIWSDSRLVATLGLNNIIVVDTKDALLVCAKDKAQDVKKIVRILKQKNFKKQL